MLGSDMPDKKVQHCTLVARWIVKILVSEYGITRLGPVGDARVTMQGA